MTYTDTQTPEKNVKLLLAVSAAVVAYFIQFIESWVWSPAWALVVFIVVLVLDYVSALLLAIKRGQGYNSAKSRRFWFQFFVQISTLGIVFNFGKLNAIYGHDSVQGLLEQLPGLAFMFMVSYNILSFIKNATLLGGYNGPVAKFLKKYIDPHKNQPKD